jgi:predicted alpha/beta hydrolase family esterase
MKRPNILYIHGFNSTGKIFNYLISQLPKHNAIVVEYNSANAINKSVEKVLEHVPHEEPFFIIGHSLGGIIAHNLAADNNLNVQGLVSISTPFGGHAIAGKLKWFYPRIKAFWDISPSSLCIANLQKTELSCPFLSIVSTDGSLPFMNELNDSVVTIDSQRAITASKTVEIDSNHFEIVQDPRTVAEIYHFIFK